MTMPERSMAVTAWRCSEALARTLYQQRVFDWLDETLGA
jgi:hypothetical protein